MHRKFGLDLVRAGAISLVLLSHFARSAEFLGLFGVELFFALSGFLIGGILYRQLTNCRRWTFEEVSIFWRRRWWRTLPNYYLFLVVSLFYHFYFGGFPTLPEFLPFLVFSQNLLKVGSPFYGVSWSLCVEEWFYLLFPLCILAFTSLRCSKRFAFIFTTLLFLTFPVVLREWLFPALEPALVRLTTLPRLDAIFYGVATSFLVARHPITYGKKVGLAFLGLAGLIGLLLFAHQCRAESPPVAFYRAAFLVLPICFSLSLPYFASIETAPRPWTLLSQPITRLSQWSYSIYLSHIPVLFTVYAAFGTARESAAVNVLSKVLGLAICVALSGVIFTYFESRLMALRPAEKPATG